MSTSAMDTAYGSGGKKPGSGRRQVELPWGKAAAFAFQSVRIRFLRSLITAGGVFLGIAFLSSILVSKGIAGPNIEASENARLNWLVALSLAVCVVGITNSMLMSVTERFREIGTMKCLGALNSFVVRIFMIEALSMGAIASVLGWAVGTGLMIGVKALMGVSKEVMDAAAAKGLPAPGPLGSLGWGDIGFSLIFCVLLGSGLTALATYIPARQAASIPPAAALRTDV